MQNPVVATGTEVSQRELDTDVEETLVPCPNHLEVFDKLLNAPSGGGAPLFWAGRLSIVLLSTCWLAGTPFTPGLQMAYETADPLLALVAVAGWVNTGPCYWVLFDETRRLVRSGPEGELVRMGAGTTPIDHNLQIGLQANKRKNSMLSFPGFGLVILIGMCPLLMLLVSGKGVHTTLHNRLACGAFMFFFCTGDGIYHAWLLTLKTATTLVSAKVRRIITSIDTASGNTMDKEQWVAEILDPCRELIHTLNLLSDGWARGTLAYVAYTIAMGFAMVCVQLTPWTRDHDNELAIRAVAAFLLCGFCAMLFLTILGPATVSSECDDLKERLNRMRITNFDVETHERLLILETAMEKSNHGQGIGFCVLGVVIDKPVLYAYTNKFFGVVTFIAPILATWSSG